MPKKITHEEFIDAVISIHGDRYDLSETIYKNSNTSIKVICREHGPFNTTAFNFKNGSNCKICTDLDKRKTKEQFISEAIAIHGDAFDYSKVIYVTSEIPVTLICTERGHEFPQRPHTHLKGFGCRLCTNEDLVMSQEEFIRRAKEIHGDLYSYDNVNYVRSKQNVFITCNFHKKDFEQTPRNHLNGAGCQECGKRKTLEEYLEEVQKIHITENGEPLYDYSKTEYTRLKDNIILICKKHGEQIINAGRHFTGSGCPVCGHETGGLKSRSNTEEFIEKSKSLYGEERYGYSKVNYITSTEPVELECLIHNKFFWTGPSNHFIRGGGCSSCTFGYMQHEWLDSLNIPNDPKHREVKLNLIDGKYIFADGYDPETNTIYEFHGDFWHGNPKRFNLEDINKKNHKTFGELYQNTLNKAERVRATGFNLVEMWEYDWEQLLKEQENLNKDK